MSEPIINEDEMIGYIMRKISDKHQLTYEEVRGVLDAEMDFLKEKGVADTAEGKGEIENIKTASSITFKLGV